MALKKSLMHTAYRSLGTPNFDLSNRISPRRYCEGTSVPFLFVGIGDATCINKSMKTKCIETKRTPSQPYGKLFVNGKVIGEHRYVYEQHYGPIPPNMVVRHMCHNSRCINPEHLTIGTKQDNANDMVQADRSLKGTKNPANKLTETQVKRIKYGNERRCDLARELGVTAYAIDAIRNGKNWAWI